MRTFGSFALQTAGAALVAGGLFHALVGNPAVRAALGDGPGPLGEMAGPAFLAAAAAVPALSRRPLGWVLAVSAPVLVVALGRYGSVDWLHVIWQGARGTVPPTAEILVASLLVPAGALLAHAAALSARRANDRRERGVPGAGGKGGALAVAVATVVASPLAFLPLLPLPGLGMTVAGLLAAAALAGVVAAARGSPRKAPPRASPDIATLAPEESEAPGSGSARRAAARSEDVAYWSGGHSASERGSGNAAGARPDPGARPGPRAPRVEIRETTDPERGPALPDR